MFANFLEEKITYFGAYLFIEQMLCARPQAFVTGNKMVGKKLVLAFMELKVNMNQMFPSSLPYSPLQSEMAQA